ncbi:MAG: hypothetical protein JXA99_12760 [Candidatus Lokiarchaeota archaeon]|nr:hypothetical protein [Candidatus Lokiarchaeota archaeon]
MEYKNNHLIELFKEKYFIERLDKSKEIIITLLEKDFFNKVNQIKWQDNEEKQLFIKEMLALTPNDRKILLEDVLRNITFE